MTRYCNNTTEKSYPTHEERLWSEGIQVNIKVAQLPYIETLLRIDCKYYDSTKRQDTVVIEGKVGALQH